MKTVKDFSFENLSEEEQLALVEEVKNCIIGDGEDSAERAVEAIPLMEQAENLPLLVLLKMLPHGIAQSLGDHDEFLGIQTRVLKMVKEEDGLNSKATEKMKELQEADG